MKTIILQYESEIRHNIDGCDKEKVFETVNKHLVGTAMVNKVGSKGEIIENPKIVNHPNFNKLKEAHYKIYATNRIPIMVRVYDDGSHDIVPIAKHGS
jgi:hypothetical protein